MSTEKTSEEKIKSKTKKYLKATFSRKNCFILGIIFSVIISSYLMVFYISAWQYQGVQPALDFFKENPAIIKYSFLVMLFLTIFVISIIGNSTISIGTMFSAITTVMFVNGEKIRSRNTPLLPEDLTMVSEAGSLTSMVDFWSIIRVIILIAGFIALGFFINKELKKRFKYKFDKRYKAVLRLCLLFFSFSALAYHTDYLRTKTEGNYVKIDFLETEINSYNQEENYRINGFIVGTICNIQPKEMKVPENYSKEEINKITKKYQKIADENNKDKKSLAEDPVDIVYVMSESFIDPELAKGIYDYGGNDPMPFTRKIMKNNTSGWAVSSEYGGGTANVEFEALTGMSNYFLSTIPYSNFVSHIPQFPSIVSFTKQNNYQTLALHPFGKTMYKRDIVYKNFGFDEFKGTDDFKYTDKIDNSQYISDESSFDQAIGELKNGDSPKFIHLITMQNHMPYDKNIYNEEERFLISGHENNRYDADRIEVFLEGINKSDVAMKKFLNEVDSLDKKTMVVFWGDHWPGIYGEMFTQKNTDVQKTPLFFYSNYGENNKNDLGSISLNYLAPTVIKETGTKMSAFQYFLLDLKKDYPALTKVFVKEDAGQKQLLKDYELLEYDLLSGKRWSAGSFYK